MRNSLVQKILLTEPFLILELWVLKEVTWNVTVLESLNCEVGVGCRWISVLEAVGLEKCVFEAVIFLKNVFDIVIVR